MAGALRIGTRGSPLALVQAELVRAALCAADAAAIEICPIRTTGDRVTDRPLAEVGGKALFTKEIDEALLCGDVDCAVHSAKDMAEIPVGLALAATLPRADVRDCLIGAGGLSTGELPLGARVGTSAVRRRAQLLARRPDLQIVSLRGNVETRLRKREAGEADAVLLAKAGLDRLGRAGVISRVLEASEMLPAAGQGAVAVLVRETDARARATIAAISHAPTLAAVTAERALLAALGGDCGTPIAAHAVLVDGRLVLDGALFSPDGSESVRGRIDGAAQEAGALGSALAGRLKSLAGPRLLALVRA